MRHRWMILAPVLGLLVAGTGVLAPAQADCISSCDMYNSNVYPNDWYSRRTTCLMNCSSQRPRIAYGALAYGTNSTAWGFSYGQGSAAAAARVALEKCKPNGDDCKVVYDFSNTCAALAAVEDKGVFESAYAPSKSRAEDAAMAACTRQHGDGCVVEVSICSLQ